MASTNTSATPGCENFFTRSVTHGQGKIVGLILAYVLSIFLYRILRPWSQPRIASDIVVGVLLGNIAWITKSFDQKFVTTLENIVDFAMICYMFVLGLEMDPYVLLKLPTQSSMLAYAGMISSSIIVCSITPYMWYSKTPNLIYTVILALSLCGSGSHVLTRIISDLKIGKSDVGKLVVAAGIHSDMISMLLMSLMFLIFPLDVMTLNFKDRVLKALTTASGLVLQIIFTATVAPLFLNWVNNENPEGKPLKGSHIVLSLAFMVLSFSISTLFGFYPFFSAFLAGLFLPNKGRVTKWTIGKINYLLSIFYPIFFLWTGYHSDFRKFEGDSWKTWLDFFVIAVVTLFGKVMGTIVIGVIFGFQWHESAELGILLTVKGHSHIFITIISNDFNFVTTSTCIMLILVIFFSIIPTPSIVKKIIRRVKKNAPTHQRSLQRLGYSDELRLLLCIHGLHHVPSSINFMEITQGTSDPGILVYLTDLIELTDEIAATIVESSDMNTITVTDKEVTSMRDMITSETRDFIEANGSRITLRRMLTLSTFNLMHQDINTLAGDLMVSLIILPFHMNLHKEGTLEGGNPGFRYVNRKVLKTAPCSVGILVDRGLGSIDTKSVKVGVIFIGGKDDREALSFAGRVARHPGVKLTVIRLLLDDDSENAPRRATNFRITEAEREAEMKLDDESFGEFYDRHIQDGHVAYTEKHLADSAETYSTLRSFQGQYELLIVGREGRVNSILTVGMNDWQQCPELGPVGDVLSGSKSSHTTSVLIIQQYSPRGEIEGIEDDFSVI